MRGCLLGILMAALASSAPMRASGAKPAPSFSLPDARGAMHQLADYKGQVVLIDFWASWCVPCKASFPVLDALHKELQPRGFSVLAINLDEERRAADAFLDVRPHVMPVLFDPKGAAATAFEVKGMPSSVIVDRQGAIRFVHMGYSEKTLPQYRLEITQLLGERNE